jgi:hypothetical protein
VDFNNKPHLEVCNRSSTNSNRRKTKHSVPEQSLH